MHSSRSLSPTPTPRHVFLRNFPLSPDRAAFLWLHSDKSPGFLLSHFPTLLKAPSPLRPDSRSRGLGAGLSPDVTPGPLSGADSAAAEVAPPAELLPLKTAAGAAEPRLQPGLDELGAPAAMEQVGPAEDAGPGGGSRAAFGRQVPPPCPVSAPGSVRPSPRPPCPGFRPLAPPHVVCVAGGVPGAATPGSGSPPKAPLLEEARGLCLFMGQGQSMGGKGRDLGMRRWVSVSL